MPGHDITGICFGSLKAIAKVGRKPNGNSVWRFLCDCGEHVDTEAYSVKTGKVRTCKACGAQRLRNASVTHGMTDTDEYRIWTGIKTRCFNKRAKAFKDYGGRGITMSKEWAESFDAFFSDMGLRPSSNHSIDRKDTNGNYSAENCRWATMSEQASNKRTTKFIETKDGRKTIPQAAKDAGLKCGCLRYRLRFEKADTATSRPAQKGGSITYNGITDTYSGWSKRTGIKTSTIAMRIHKYNWPLAKALTKGAGL